MKNGSKFKRLVEKPYHQKIVDLLTDGKGKWNATKKNHHESIAKGALTEPIKVWFYFFMFGHATFQTFMHSQRERGSIIICHPHGLLIQCAKDNRKLNSELLQRRLQRADPSPNTDFKTLHIGGVQGDWEEKENCPKTSPLTLTGITKGPKNINRGRHMEGVREEEEPMEIQ